MMYWQSCSKEPPLYDGEYEVLVLDCDWLTGAKHWATLPGKYYCKDKLWDLWVDGFGWSGDSGYEPYYWCSLPPFPPIPYDGPLCEYYVNECCSGQKHTPHCPCQGNKEHCLYYD